MTTNGTGGGPSDLKLPPIVQKALQTSNEACKIDNAAKNIPNLDERYEAYHKASNLYGDAVRQILLCKSRQLPDALMKRLRTSGYEYMDRAEELKKKLVEVGYLNTNGEVKKGGAAASAMSNGTTGRTNDQDPSSKSAAEPLDESDGLIEKPNVLWTDIAGLEAAKQSLSEAVIMPRRFPQLYYGRRQAWKGILLYGPPGTGKSYLAKAVATEVNSTFISLSASDIVSKWMGDSEKNIRKKFEAARAHQPAVIFFDEIDALCGPRGEGESEASRRIKTELLIQMDGVGKDTTGILVLAATNIPWQLDTAIRRRFQKRVHIGLPDAPARARMFQLELHKNKHTLSKEDFKTLGQESAGRSGSDIKALVGQALAYPIRRIDEAMHFKKVPSSSGSDSDNDHSGATATATASEKEKEKKKDWAWAACSPADPHAVEMTWKQIPEDETLDDPECTLKDVRRALADSRASVSAEDIRRNEEWTREFGTEG